MAAAPDPEGARLAEAAAISRMRQAIARGECPTGTVRPLAPAAALPVRERGVAHMAYVRLLVEGCGQADAWNYLVRLMPDGEARIDPMLHGTTILELGRQQDVALRVRMHALARLNNGCRESRVMLAAFDGPLPRPDSGRMDTPWRETWYVEACDSWVAVPLDFTPGPRGPTWRIDNATLQQLR